MKIIFFGTANVALPILEALRKEHEVLAVVTVPDAKSGRSQEFAESPVSALATDLKLPVLKPESPKTDAAFLNQLKEYSADIFVVVAYGKILPTEIINLPKHKSINVHFAPLPKYRGASPIQTALLNGDEYSGTSIFILDEQVDHGPLLAQQIVKIDPSDNFFTLSDKLARVSAELINSVIADYVSGKITPLPQDEQQASFTKIITKENGKINWQNPAGEIYNQFRAFFPWPGIWTTWNGKKIKITDCAPVDLELQKAVGIISEGGVVACGNNSFLQIKSLKPEGKSEMLIKDFLNGNQQFIGSKLE